MCEPTAQALEADSKPVAPLTPQEYIRLIETHLGMIDAMLADTRALIERYRKEQSCSPPARLARGCFIHQHVAGRTPARN